MPKHRVINQVIKNSSGGLLFARRPEDRESFLVQTTTPLRDCVSAYPIYIVAHFYSD